MPAVSAFCPGIVALLLIAPAAGQNTDPNTTFCTTACVNFGYHHDYCSFYDPVNGQTVPSCTCYDPYSSEPWNYYSYLLGCVSCDQDGLGEEDLTFYQEWAVVCNLFSANGNDAAETAFSYGARSPLVSAFSTSILPPLQSEGNDGGVAVQVAVNVNGTMTTVGGDTSGGQTSAAPVSPAATADAPASATQPNGAGPTMSSNGAEGEEDMDQTESEDSGQGQSNSASSACGGMLLRKGLLSCSALLSLGLLEAL